MPAYAYAILAAGWFVWLLPFVLAKRPSVPARRTDPRARWGMLLQAIAYGLLWQGAFWKIVPRAWQFAASILFLSLGALLSWTSVRALGLQWRLDAALSSDHELVTSGPYTLIRHPIYTSMLCILLGTGILVLSPWLCPALILAIAGTEIRVRIEDRLLASQFGERFVIYRRHVPAYIPHLR
jgi:protein-S-isoprenylcysteine O-methyltransferase Ste14